MLAVLSIIVFLLGAFDTWLSQRRIKAYGINVELNWLIRKLSTLLGPQLATIIGIMVPTCGWAYIFTVLNFPVGLALMIGYKAKLFNIQLQSLVFESQVKAFKKELDEKNLGRKDATLPSSESTDESDPPNPFKYSERYDPRDRK